MPWTSFEGWYYLIGLEDWEGEGLHWLVELENGDTCYVPYDSVRNPEQYIVDIL